MSTHLFRPLLSCILLAGCATPPAPPLLPERGPFGSEQSFTGVLALGYLALDTGAIRATRPGSTPS